MRTIQELLNVPRFADLKLLNKNGNLKNMVEGIEITEAPDIAEFIPENTLLLTTAMFFKNNQEELLPFIDTLQKAGVSALGIKLGRFLEKIDQEVLDYADSLHFPIIQIPGTTPLGPLLQQLLNYLWDVRKEEISYAMDIQKNLTKLLVDDVSVSRFIVEFAKIIKVPIILLNPLQEIIAQSNHFISIKNNPSYYIDQIKGKGLFQSEDHSLSFTSEKKGQKWQGSIYPLKVHRNFPYFLCVLHPELLPYPISEFAIEQAGIILSFILFKNQAVEESLLEVEKNFFKQMMEQQNNSPKEKDWLEIGKPHGFIESDFYQVIFIHCTHDNDELNKVKYKQEKTLLVFLWLRSKLQTKLNNPLLFYNKEENIIQLILQEHVKDMERILLSATEELEIIFPVSLVFSLGRPSLYLNHLTSSYIEAKLAYKKSLKKEHVRFHYFERDGIMNLFNNFDTSEVNYYCQAFLGDLANPEDIGQIELRKTLRTYLNNQCEITKTAADLYIHRHTVKYRINKCREIIGKPIEEPSISLGLRIALELSASEDELILE